MKFYQNINNYTLIIKCRLLLIVLENINKIKVTKICLLMRLLLVLWFVYERMKTKQETADSKLQHLLKTYTQEQKIFYSREYALKYLHIFIHTAQCLLPAYCEYPLTNTYIYCVFAYQT